MGTEFKSISPVPFNHAPVYGMNSGEGSGLAGAGETDGIIGSGKINGIVGFSTDSGTGVLGAAKNGAGGHFISQNGFSVIAGGVNASKGIESSGFGILSFGINYLTKTTCLAQEKAGYSSSMAMYFYVNPEDVILPGDVLVATKTEGHLKKAHEKGQTNVIGIAVEKAAILLNTPDELLKSEIIPAGRQGALRPKGMELVALTGVVMIRATAKEGAIHPGDLLISAGEAGLAKKLNVENIKPGAVFAKALGILESGEGLIRALLIHSV
jgi:hypothetical protein